MASRTDSRFVEVKAGAGFAWVTKDKHVVHVAILKHECIVKTKVSTLSTPISMVNK